MAAVTTGASLDTTGFVNPECLVTAVEAYAPQVVGSLLLPLDESAAPVYNQVRQEQIVAEETPQIVDVLEDVDAAILRHEEWLRDQRLKIDRCVNMLKTKKEDLEQYEKKEAVLLARSPSHDWRDLQRVIDENRVLVLRHRQFVQTCK